MKDQNKTLSEIIRMNIKKYRKIAKKSQKELGVSLGYDPEQAQQRISQYEGGSRSPNKETISLIAKALGIPAEALIMENYEDRMIELFKQTLESRKQHSA